MILPLSAIVGFSTARRALLCTLVDPTLRGVVVSGPVGTGKSTLMRSFGAFVREHVDAATPVVPVPLNVSDDRLLGGVDLDASIEAGAIRARAGLLAGAAGGYLFVDDLPLLEEMSIATIARALESETVITEREGISRREHSRFVLLATTVPTERDLSLGVADRVA
ncbi:MAG TPA: AAA family ATPase, partial [Candidatus Kapabacteria bacterium]|nr:AAA family ATPase [Candidatus Kapabacteria bacterium]